MRAGARGPAHWPAGQDLGSRSAATAFAELSPCA